MTKLILSAIMMICTLSSFGQTANQKYKAHENTYVGVFGSALIPTDMNHVTPVNPGFGIKVGKLINPVWGFNLEGATWLGENHYTTSSTTFKAVNVGLNTTVNLTSKSKFALMPEIGIGWLHVFDKYASTDDDVISAKTGIVLGYNVSKAVSIFIEPQMRWNLTGQYPLRFNKHLSQLGVEIGLAYRFKNNDGSREFKTYNIADYNDRINALQGALQQKPTVVKHTIVKEVVKEIVKSDNRAVVFFAKASDTILDFEALKKIEKGASVEVHGYASPEGSDSFNLKLSQSRAEKVAHFLEKRGVNVLKVIGHGSVDNTSNRVVIVY